jgi:putative endonuclease
MNGWSVYLIRTASGALYTGIARDVDRRVEQHTANRGAKCLRGRGPLILVYQRRIGDRALASRVEHAVKRLNKADKEALVAVGPSRRRLLQTMEISDS